MDGSKLTSALLQMSQSRNSEKNSLNRTDSVSSFPVTNYEDSEFMIQAYQRKKKAYEKCKQRLLEVESELHMEKQRAKMYSEENKRYKITLK
jgi:predicted mannosyl-3-phosphoglycerate phosphatase (HAD superfamily)